MVNREALENLTFDSNGYSKSIMQDDLSRCYLCGRYGGDLVRHEPIHGKNRKNSKAYGMWVNICPIPCHNLAHCDIDTDRMLKQRAQVAAQATYQWTTQEFIEVFGRNYFNEP